jgi:hypothetical protein
MEKFQGLEKQAGKTVNGEWLMVKYSQLTIHN